MADGYRESEQSWKELLLDCKARGLEIEPPLAIGDGALGFWKALRQVWPDDQGAALLGAQDGERAGQAAQGRAAQGQGDAARHLAGRDAGRRPRRRSTCSWRPTRRSTPRRRSAWPRTGRSCWPSTTSRRSTGCTCGRPTRSSRRSPRCGCGRRRRRGAGAGSACLTMVFKLMESGIEELAVVERLSPPPGVIAGAKFVDGIEDKDAA